MSTMTNEQIEDMIRAIVSAADYDIGKTLDPELAEEPDEVPARMAELVAIAREHLK